MATIRHEAGLSKCNKINILLQCLIPGILLLLKNASAECDCPADLNNCSNMTINPSDVYVGGSTLLTCDFSNMVGKTAESRLSRQVTETDFVDVFYGCSILGIPHYAKRLIKTDNCTATSRSEGKVIQVRLSNVKLNDNYLNYTCWRCKLQAGNIIQYRYGSLSIKEQVNGEWSSWTTWSQCSKTCSNGTEYRSRNCDNPKPQGGGSECSGHNNETINCFLRHCPDKPEEPKPQFQYIVHITSATDVVNGTIEAISGKKLSLSCNTNQTEKDYFIKWFFEKNGTINEISKERKIEIKMLNESHQGYYRCVVNSLKDIVVLSSEWIRVKIRDQTIFEKHFNVIVGVSVGAGVFLLAGCYYCRRTKGDKNVNMYAITS